MDGYISIYVKKDRIGHVRYEVGDNFGHNMIRGLSVENLFGNKKTIYEKGEYDSHGISVYDKTQYAASEKIPLSREELVTALAYLKTADEEKHEYGVIKKNCNDFTIDLLSAIGKKGCVQDYLTEEQTEYLKLSRISDILLCKLPNETTNMYDKAKEKISQSVCKGIVKVDSYMRLGEKVEGYVRTCGRH